MIRRTLVSFRFNESERELLEEAVELLSKDDSLYRWRRPTKTDAIVLAIGNLVTGLREQSAAAELRRPQAEEKQKPRTQKKKSVAR